jgi:hypothetical protein
MASSYVVQLILALACKPGKRPLQVVLIAHVWGFMDAVRALMLIFFNEMLCKMALNASMGGSGG